MTRLADLGDGTVTLTDAMMSISGVAASQSAYGEARSALSADMPSTIALGPVDIMAARADPFVWSANYDGSQVVLSGFVPNEVVHETLLATVKATLSRAALVDKTAIASGEPEGFAEAATFAIAALGRFNEGGVTLDGMKLDIAGVSRSVDDYEAALDGLRNGLPPGVKVVSNAIKPAVVSPYGWKGERDGANIVLSGYVPSEEGRAEVTAAIRRYFTGLNVSDKLRVAAGEPKMDWIGGIKFAMSELARLGHGAVSLGDKTLSIEGEAASPEAFADLLAMNARTLPASLELARADVTPPKVSPYRFVVLRGAAQIQLAGFAPTDKDKQAILELARKNFAANEIVDKLVFAGGAPSDFVPAVAVALQAVTRLGGGRGEIVDSSLTIRGARLQPGCRRGDRQQRRERAPQGFQRQDRDRDPAGRPAGRARTVPRPHPVRGAARTHRVRAVEGEHHRRQLRSSRSRCRGHGPLPGCEGRSRRAHRRRRLRLEKSRPHPVARRGDRRLSCRCGNQARAPECRRLWRNQACRRQQYQSGQGREPADRIHRDAAGRRLRCYI